MAFQTGSITTTVTADLKPLREELARGAADAKNYSIVVDKSLASIEPAAIAVGKQIPQSISAGMAQAAAATDKLSADIRSEMASVQPAVQSVADAIQTQMGAGLAEAGQQAAAMAQGIKAELYDIEPAVQAVGATIPTWAVGLGDARREMTGLASATNMAAQASAKAGQSSRGFIQDMKAEFGRGSDLGQTIRMLQGFGPVAGFSLISMGLANAAGEARKLADAMRDTDMSAGQMTEELIGMVPILGGIWKAGRDIREIITGEQAAIRAMNVEAERTSLVMKLRLEIQERNIAATRRDAEAMADLNFQIAKLAAAKAGKPTEGMDLAKSAADREKQIRDEADAEIRAGREANEKLAPLYAERERLAKARDDAQAKRERFESSPARREGLIAEEQRALAEWKALDNQIRGLQNAARPVSVIESTRDERLGLVGQLAADEAADLARRSGEEFVRELEQQKARTIEIERSAAVERMRIQQGDHAAALLELKHAHDEQLAEIGRWRIEQTKKATASLPTGIPLAGPMISGALTAPISAVASAREAAAGEQHAAAIAAANARNAQAAIDANERVKSSIADMRAELAGFTLSDVEREVSAWQRQNKDATQAQIDQVRRLKTELAAASDARTMTQEIDRWRDSLKGPAEKYDEILAKLRTWRDEQKITGDEFAAGVEQAQDQLRSAQQKPEPQQSRMAQFIKAGSAEAARFTFQAGRQKDDVQKDQLNVAKRQETLQKEIRDRLAFQVVDIG